MYKNNLPNVKTYYQQFKITYQKKKKLMDSRLVPLSMNLSIYYFVNPKYLDL